MISSMRLDGEKDIQSVKQDRPICLQSLNPAFYPFLMGIIHIVKRTLVVNDCGKTITSKRSSDSEKEMYKIHDVQKFP